MTYRAYNDDFKQEFIDWIFDNIEKNYPFEFGFARCGRFCYLTVKEGDKMRCFQISVAETHE